MGRGGRAVQSWTPAYRAIDWERWRPDERATLLFVRHEAEVLLIEKKRGLGAGKVNGPGGRIQPGESALECAVRETREEVGIEALGVHQAGELAFQFADGFGIHVTVFAAGEHRGQATESEEAVPLWTSIAHIPYERMWADDRFWLPWMLDGLPFEGRALFDGDELLGYEFRAEPSR